jgi:hypothetical protein
MPVTVGSGTGPAVEVLYRTDDGGQTWQAGPELPAGAGVGPASLGRTDTLLSVPLAPVAFAANPPGTALWRTTDGGADWSRVRSAVSLAQAAPIGANLEQLDFVSSSVGFARVQIATAGGPGTVLLVSTDGGTRWVRVRAG